MTEAPMTYDLTLDDDGTVHIYTPAGIWAGDWTLADGTTADLGDEQDMVEEACIALIEDAEVL